MGVLEVSHGKEVIMAFCPQCGTEQAEGAVVCTNCGAPLVAPEQPAVPEQPVVPEAPAAPQEVAQPQAPEAFQPQAYQPQQAYQQPAYQSQVQPDFQAQGYQAVPPYAAAPMPVPNPTDHTAEFDPADVAENKLYALLAYLTSVIGIIVALLADKESPYLKFHIRQVLKLTIVETLLALIIAILSWTVIVPIVGGIAMVVVLVVEIICIVRVCGNKSVEPPIISSLKFLN